MEDKNISIVIQGENSTFGKTEEYKRSDHNDFATSNELKDRRFSGLRLNSITNTREIWVEGELMAWMCNRLATEFPERWDTIYKQLFDLN